MPVVTVDLMKRQEVQGTFLTRSVPLPQNASDIQVHVGLPDDYAASPFELLAEMYGLFAGGWRLLIGAAFPGPDQIASGAVAQRVRVQLDPSRLAALDVTVSYTIP